MNKIKSFLLYVTSPWRRCWGVHFTRDDGSWGRIERFYLWRALLWYNRVGSLPDLKRKLVRI